MKKFLIAIVVILSVLLIVQLAYYNFRNNSLYNEGQDIINAKSN